MRTDAGHIKSWVDRAIKEQDNGLQYISAAVPTYSAK